MMVIQWWAFILRKLRICPVQETVNDQTVLRRNVNLLRAVPCRKETLIHDSLFQRKPAQLEWGVGGDQRRFCWGREPYCEKWRRDKNWTSRGIGGGGGRCQCTQRFWVGRLVPCSYQEWKTQSIWLHPREDTGGGSMWGLTDYGCAGTYEGQVRRFCLYPSTLGSHSSF